MLARLTRNTTPGKDKITYRILRNLDEETLQELLTLFNAHWQAGTLPADWRHSDITLIPKPNKPLTPTTLRPISLTSCLVKLFEHLIHQRLTEHLEKQNLYPFTMFGFRQQLSTQDVLIQIKEEVLDHLSRTTPKTILTLDVKGAFDNVTHQAILDNLNTTGCGLRTFQFVSAFLRDRTATLRLGPLTSTRFHTPAKGTPQGSVISPLLFNIAMLHLPAKLHEIPGIHHAFYADDLTIWTTWGSSGEQQDSLQQAIDTTMEYLHPRGLTCEPSKSGLLVLLAQTRGRKANTTPDPQVSISSAPIPQVPTLRILGVPFHQDGSGSALLPQLHKTVTQLTHLIRRIRGSSYGLRESDTCRLVQALITSRITYGTPFVNLKPQETNKLDALIRKTYKSALSLPTYTANERLMKLGLHNTLNELIEAQRVSQLQRLSLTPTGRQVLHNIGRTPPPAHLNLQRIPLSIRQQL